MGGSAFDVYRVVRADGRHRPRCRHLGAGHVPRQRPDRGRGHAGAAGSLAGPHRRRGRADGLRSDRAGGGQRPRGAEDRRRAGDRTTTAPSRPTGSRARSSGSATAASPTSTRSWPTLPAARRGSSSTASTPGFVPGKPENKHGIRLSNTAALFLDEVEVPADRLVGGVEGQGLVQAQLVFGYTRLMVAAFGLGRRLGRPRPGDPLLGRADPGRRPALGEAGLHPQADRAPRRAAGGGQGVHRGDRRTPRRDPHRPQHRGGDRQVPGDRGGQRRRRRRHPGPRRLRLHPRVHGREDQAGRADHHDLRGHLGDHGDDHRPRPLAAAPQDQRPLLPRRRHGARGARIAPTPPSVPTSPPSPTTPWPRCSSGRGSAA